MGTGTTPLPNSQLQRSAPKTGCAGGSGLSRSRSPQSGRDDGRDHRRRRRTQPGALVRMGPDQHGYRATSRCCFLGQPGDTFHNREKSIAAVRRGTRAPECSYAWHPKPCYRRVPAEPGLGAADLAPVIDKSYGTSCQPYSTHRTAGSGGDKGSRGESGDRVLLLPWLTAFTRGRDSRQWDAD